MTPDQERKLDRVLEALSTLQSLVLKYEQRIGILERGHKTAARWLRKLLEERASIPPSEGSRATLPSISPDDSGSIEISAFGTSGKFQGKWPVRFALGFLFGAFMLVMGWLGHSLVR